jgi:hypothetical protein
VQEPADFGVGSALGSAPKFLSRSARLQNRLRKFFHGWLGSRMSSKNIFSVGSALRLGSGFFSKIGSAHGLGSGSGIFSPSASLYKFVISASDAENERKIELGNNLVLVRTKTRTQMQQKFQCRHKIEEGPIFKWAPRHS